ncbi:MAG TPA: hypothetical protein P5186_17565 [Candidatus Paceibacterota bacterium]|nr:hypothetical protein [Verrucomicrobiota bacterium]HRY49860.1 hypothetical protein [Candidatus Paceibacterota bacterium]HSA03489.1 hypothetical protein [Candidatus Paceibacterota bacterium]
MIRIIAAWLLLATSLVRGESGSDKLLESGVVEFNAAYQAWNPEQFLRAAALFRQASTNSTASALSFYWIGATEFHRMLQLQSAPSSPASASMAQLAGDAAIAALNRAVDLDPRHAESHALLGTLYGMKINGNLLRVLRFGPRVQKHQEMALKHGAENPRVRYLLGTCQFHMAKKPEAWQEALATFLAAEQLFLGEIRQPPQPLDPRWGYSSCLTFIGRTYVLLGRSKEAADYFRKAIALHPADHLAQEGLLGISRLK